MRGKGFYRGFRSFSDGITPAYAGKRDKALDGVRRARDHPRLCGEKGYRYTFSILPVGSPPPMRGKDRRTVCEVLALGITPAYAGKRDFL